MRILKLTLLAAAGFTALSGSAFAADLLSPPPAAAPVIDNTTGWDGAYVGAFFAGQTAPNAYGLGVDLGVNTLMNGLLLGGELEGTWYTSNAASGQITGKIGTSFGDAAIGYVYSGAGSRTATSWYVPVGAGVEFKLANNVGLKTEAQYNFDLTNSSEDSAAVKVGLNWHF